MRTVWALAGSVVIAGAAFAQPPSHTPRFSEVVAEHFESWDADHNGRISPTEIDRACVNSAIRGPEAAAVAALKRIVRSEKYELPPLTREFLSKSSSRTGRHSTPRSIDREDSTEKVSGQEAHADPAAPSPAPAPIPDFQGRYSQCLSRIEKTDRSLFRENAPPATDHCHQGPLGDCFFVSIVGGAVHHDPATVRSMITPLDGDRGYDVRFGNGRAVHVSPLTDAEVAISSTTADRTGHPGGEGLWLAVLEKAFGTLRITDTPSRYSTESATDAIAKGGSTSSSIQLLTGHQTDRIPLKRQFRVWNPDQTDRDGKHLSSAAHTTRPAGDLEDLEKKTRAGIDRALRAGRLVAAGTADEKVPPGMSPKHAYAVLAFNPDTDVVTVWNPHGNAFHPRGQPGITTGYPTKSGVFEIPVKDFVQVFNGVTLETDRPIRGHARG
jgi:hypothetical protein